MRVALLVCDHVPQKFSKDHGDYRSMFENAFGSLHLSPYYVIDGSIPDIDKYDAFIITGSRFSVYDNEKWIINLKRFTKSVFDEGKKLVGVCFGHQMIAEALGGKVQRSDVGYLIGIHNFSIVEEKEWMEPFSEDYKILMLCQDQVVSLPPHTEVLSSSSQCPVGMFQIEERFLGIQGHPEFTKEYNQAVFESRPDVITNSKMESAYASFKEQPDNQLLIGYIENFLRK